MGQLASNPMRSSIGEDCRVAKGSYRRSCTAFSIRPSWRFRQALALTLHDVFS